MGKTKKERTCSGDGLIIAQGSDHWDGLLFFWYYREMGIWMLLGWGGSYTAVDLFRSSGLQICDTTRVNVSSVWSRFDGKGMLLDLRFTGELGAYFMVNAFSTSTGFFNLRETHPPTSLTLLGFPFDVCRP